MRSKLWMVWVAGAVIALGALSTITATWAQAQPLPWAQAPQPVQPVPPVSEPFPYVLQVAPGVPGSPAYVDVRAHSEAMSKINEAAVQLRDAGSDEAKASAARKKLVEQLAKYFDDDMKTRTADLAKVKANVAKLEAQLAKRSGKKQEIIDLQVKILENEADGLGFFNQPTPARSLMRTTTVGPTDSWQSSAQAAWPGYQAASPATLQPTLQPTNNTANEPYRSVPPDAGK